MPECLYMIAVFGDSRAVQHMCVLSGLFWCVFHRSSLHDSIMKQKVFVFIWVFISCTFFKTQFSKSLLKFCFKSFHFEMHFRCICVNERVNNSSKTQQTTCTILASHRISTKDITSELHVLELWSCWTALVNVLIETCKFSAHLTLTCQHRLFVEAALMTRSCTCTWAVHVSCLLFYFLVSFSQELSKLHVTLQLATGFLQEI